MGRTTFSGPLKSVGGFEIGSGGSGSDGTHTEVISATGGMTLAGDATIGGNVTISGNLDVTGEFAGQKMDFVNITTNSVATTLTVAQSGSIVNLGIGGITVNLPSATVTGQEGAYYTFLQTTAASAATLIDPATGDKIMGYVTLHETAASEPNFQSLGTAGAGTDNAILTLTASVAAVGHRLSIVGDGSAGWYVTDSMIAAGGVTYATT
jgi:hypothetical protein